MQKSECFLVIKISVNIALNKMRAKVFKSRDCSFIPIFNTLWSKLSGAKKKTKQKVKGIACCERQQRKASTFKPRAYLFHSGICCLLSHVLKNMICFGVSEM